MASRGAPQAAIAATTNMVTPLKVATLYRISIIAEQSGDYGSAIRAFLAG
jgi:TolA-binding protein